MGESGRGFDLEFMRKPNKNNLNHETNIIEYCGS